MCYITSRTFCKTCPTSAFQLLWFKRRQLIIRYWQSLVVVIVGFNHIYADLKLSWRNTWTGGNCRLFRLELSLAWWTYSRECYFGWIVFNRISTEARVRMNWTFQWGENIEKTPTFKLHSNIKAFLEPAVGTSLPLRLVDDTIPVSNAGVDLLVLDCSLEEPLARLTSQQTVVIARHLGCEKVKYMNKF